jgi:hypothetical protein
MRPVRRVLGVSSSYLLALAICACSSSGGPGSGGAAGASGASGLPPELAAELDAFADAYAHAWCDGLASCCHFWPFHADVCLDSARLRARQGVALGAAPEFASPFFNAAARDTCLAQIQKIVASCPATTFQHDAAPQCASVFTKGSAPLGASCQSGDDCAPTPDQPPLCADGKCAMVAMNLPAGASCAGPFAKCASDLACGTVDYTCGPKIALGKRCSYDSDCVDGAYCDGVCTLIGNDGDRCAGITSCHATSSCIGGVCQPLAQTGSSCTSSSACLLGDYCSPQTKVCTTRVPIGEPCPFSPTNEEPCAEDGWCSRTSGTLLKPGDTSPLVCVPKDLPILCFTG